MEQAEFNGQLLQNKVGKKQNPGIKTQLGKSEGQIKSKAEEWGINDKKPVKLSCRYMFFKKPK